MSDCFTLICNNVETAFNQEKIFSNLRINCSFKKVLLIKGPVGSGKTTLLKLISKIYKPQKGEITIRKAGVPANIYYIHSNPEFNFVTGYIEDEFILSGVPKKLIPGYKGRYVNELSGGELKKIAITIALKSSADLIVMDEPFEMLDDEEVKSTGKIILESSDNRSFIIATHENILDKYADQCIEITK